MTEQEKPAGATVLVIDDDGRIHAALRTILESAGHEVIEAYDGGTATEIFQAQHDEIDIVIIDWKMPGLDGHNWIRRRLETQVVGFLDKPIDQARLLSFVGEALARRQAAASGPPGE